MTISTTRRSLLQTAAAGAAMPLVGMMISQAAGAKVASRAEPRLHYFDYSGVTLLPGRFKDQVQSARDFYFAMSEDDILRGYRAEAGMPAPGKPMKGWCTHNCDGTFGQWLSGMARMSRALGDAPLRAKAIRLFEEWQKTLVKRTPVTRWSTYGWEKLSCGLLDLALYADHPPALDRLVKITEWGRDTFDRSRLPATPEDRDGRRPNGALEWYTLAENSLRAWQTTGNRMFLDFANLWKYDEYWDRFLTTSRPDGVALRHSYSHVNTFCSAAMFHAVTGDPRYLTMLRNAYDWVRNTQGYASGGFGPGEWTVAADGSLGEALETRLDTAELPCGSWAGFKLSRYLTGFTGEARYGDWVETLLFNGIGAALPIQPDGRAFYYADYRVGLGTKTYFWDEWPCCSGTYIQAIADYHNVIYQRGDDGLYVSQLVPSEVKWMQGVPATLTLETRYPDEDTARLSLRIARPTRFKLRIRVPAWCDGASATVNGQPVAGRFAAGDWAVIDRTWSDRDTVTFTVPMTPRLVPVDPQHPNRVAVMYGPAMMAQNGRFTYPISGSPAEIVASLKRKPGDTLALASPAGPPSRQGGQPVGDLVPFNTFGERVPYRSYFDIDKPRFI